jgi:hypothetical protein
MSRPARTRWFWLTEFGSILLLLVVGGIYLWEAGYDIARDIALSGDRPVAEATVLQLVHDSKGSGIRTVDVEFVTVDGRRVHGPVYEFRNPAPAVGTTLPVRYNQKHPGRYVRDASQGPTVYAPAFFIPLGLLSTAGGVFLLCRVPRRWRLRPARSLRRPPGRRREMP